MAVPLTNLSTDSLDSLLQVKEPITIQARREIANSLWEYRNLSARVVDDEDELQFYFSYYTEQCDLFAPGRNTWARTHRDVITISAVLQQDLKREKNTRRTTFKIPSCSNEPWRSEIWITLSALLFDFYS